MTDDTTGETATDGSGISTGVNALASKARIGKFVSVGAAGATLEQLIVVVTTAGLAFDPLLAKLIGAEASISLMFLINDRWTFAGHGTGRLRAVVGRWVRSHTVRAVGLAVSFATLFVLTARTEVTVVVAGVDLWPTIANGVGIAGGMVINYVAESLFTWRVTR